MGGCASRPKDLAAELPPAQAPHHSEPETLPHEKNAVEETKEEPLIDISTPAVETTPEVEEAKAADPDQVTNPVEEEKPEPKEAVVEEKKEAQTVVAANKPEAAIQAQTVVADNNPEATEAGKKPEVEAAKKPEAVEPTPKTQEKNDAPLVVV